MLANHQGSISAEHGLGVAKNEFLGYSKSPVMIKMMKNMKNMLDPNGIMNPYKVNDRHFDDRFFFDNML